LSRRGRRPGFTRNLTLARAMLYPGPTAMGLVGGGLAVFGRGRVRAVERTPPVC